MLKKEDNSGKLLNVLPLAIIICNENVLKSFFWRMKKGKSIFRNRRHVIFTDIFWYQPILVSSAG